MTQQSRNMQPHYNIICLILPLLCLTELLPPFTNTFHKTLFLRVFYQVYISQNNTHNFFLCHRSPKCVQAASLWRFLEHIKLDTHTHTHTPVRTPLNEGSVRRRNQYLHHEPKRRISMPSAGFKPAIPTIKKLQTYALDRRATGISAYKKAVCI